MAANMISILSLLAVTLSSLTTAAPVASPEFLQSRCTAGLFVIAARGTNQDPGVGSLSAVTELVTKYAPDTTVLAVDYPATMENPAYMDSVKMGASNLQQMIINIVDACPSNKIALLGYSQGANVVGDAIAGSSEDANGTPALGPNYVDNIKAVVLMGDPTHSQEQKFVIGGGVNNGMVPRINGYELAPFTDRIVSFCRANDPVCDSGNDMEVHWSYMENYAINGAWFTLANLWNS